MNEPSKSEQIRQLSKQGRTTKEIANILGIRYQFVYNVLKREGEKATLDQVAEQRAGYALDIQRPDAQGRISIGPQNADETYSIERLKNGDILLRPVAVIHKQEAWLFQNREALESVRRGLEQSAVGDTHDLGSFSQYAAAEED